MYDLSEDKHEPLCEQKVVKNRKLTKVAFNPRHPIMVVGDDRCALSSLGTAMLC